MSWFDKLGLASGGVLVGIAAHALDGVCTSISSPIPVLIFGLVVIVAGLCKSARSSEGGSPK